jgi:hypothetical protein
VADVRPSRQKIYTRTNLFDKNLYDILHDRTAHLDAVKWDQVDTPDKVEYVVKVEPFTGVENPQGPGDWCCSYYMVDHANRILFWLSEFDAYNMIQEIDSVSETSHVSK